MTLRARAIALFLAALTAALGSARAEAAAPLVSVPAEVPQVDELWHLPLAVTDDGRAGFAGELTWRHSVAGVIAPGARTAVMVPVPGLFDVAGVAFDGAGSLVGGGLTDTGEAVADPEDQKSSSCCDRPSLFRWGLRAGATPQVLAPAPDRHASFALGAFALDRQGTAYLAAGVVPDYGDRTYAMLLRVPRHGPTAWRAVPAPEPEPATYVLRPDDDGAGVTALTDDDYGHPHRLSADARGWRATVPPPRRFAHDLPLLGPGGRLLRVVRRAGVFWLDREGEPETAVGRATPHGRSRFAPIGAFNAVVGRDGTVAVAWSRGGALLLRTIAPDGRRGPERRLGAFRGSGGEVLVRVDDQGHAHVLFSARHRRVVAVGPGGRRVLGDGSETLVPAAIALSPRGGEALAVASRRGWLITARAAPR
jgi:hypothetical protein